MRVDTETGTNPFWEFSLAIYARPEVARTCLALQEARGVDVNLLLWCCWRARCGEALSPADIAAADRSIGAWRRDVVLPLRGLRQGLRGYPAAESTRALIERAELEAERVQQRKMYENSASGAGGEIALDRNLAAFAAFMQLEETDLAAFRRAAEAGLAELPGIGQAPA